MAFMSRPLSKPGCIAAESGIKSEQLNELIKVNDGVAIAVRIRYELLAVGEIQICAQQRTQRHLELSGVNAAIAGCVVAVEHLSHLVK